MARGGDRDLANVHADYQRIQLADAAAAFRLVKLRAEARMLEASRTAMLAAFVLALALAILSGASQVTVEGANWVSWSIRLTLPLLLASIFRRLELPAWNRYFGSLSSVAALLPSQGGPEA